MSAVFQEQAAARQEAPATRHVPYGALQRQTLDIYLPKDRKPRAVIVFIYGGGWTSGDKSRYQPLAPAFTGRGYAFVVPDYRTYPNALFPDFVEDAALAIKWVQDNRARFGNAPMFLMGHSAGAHTGALLTLDARYLRAHGIEPSIIRGFIGVAGPYALNPAKWPVVREIFSPASPPESARPIKLAQGRTAPMLLLHGTLDRIARSENSVRLGNVVRAAGSPVEVKLYPLIGHFEILFAFAWGWRWRANVLNDVDAFITRELKR